MVVGHEDTAPTGPVTDPSAPSARRWCPVAGGPVTTGPVVSNGTLLVGTDAELIAYRRG